ncbi:hypothetical protein CPC08DRAFT_814364 [Agrocybe pediades]|nr:hypothetical protein CPC08DRAFT_814364 [Agrocybe pediades]
MTSNFDLFFPKFSRESASSSDAERRVFDILKSYAQTSSTTTAESVANEIDVLYPTNPATGTIDYMTLEHLWELFVGIAEQIPWTDSAQDKLVEVLKALRDLPQQRSMVIDHWEKVPVKIWADIPVLPYVLSDGVETHGVIINDESEAEKQSRIRDLNFQGFAARLTNAKIFDLSRLAVYRIRSVLEDDADYYITGYDDVGTHLDVNILPAQVWIDLTSKLLYDLCQENGAGAARNDIAGGKHWKGAAGFSRARWDFWKQKLDEIAENDKAKEETRKTARKMKATMLAAEA